VSALYSNTTGYQNTANGVNALVSNTTGNYNTANGMNALVNNTASGDVGLGYSAGRYTTSTGNEFFVNNIDQSTYANDKAYSLLYGNFAGSAATTTGQFLTVNGNLYSSGNVGIGTTNPGSKVTSTGDVFVTTSAAGVILTDSAAACWRIAVAPITGILSTGTVSCPTF
jgi:hypothetical protein